MSAQYITKYAAEIEARADARVDPVTFEDIKLQSTGLQNAKNAGSKVKHETSDTGELS